jgi:hypothetical protein
VIVKVTREDIAKGMPSTPRKCPIALAMMRELGILRQFSYRYVTVTGEVAESKLGQSERLRTWLMPLPAQQFQTDFDNGLPVEPLEFEASEVNHDLYA